MARRCELTGIGVQTGNNVSHSQVKTRRRFLPNLHVATLHSDVLGQGMRFRVSSKALRSVEHRGGLDNYLLKARDSSLSRKALQAKKQVIAARAASAGAPEQGSAAPPVGADGQTIASAGSDA